MEEYDTRTPRHVQAFVQVLPLLIHEYHHRQRYAQEDKTALLREVLARVQAAGPLEPWEDPPQATPHDLQHAAAASHTSALFSTLVHTFEALLPVFADLFTRQCPGVLEAFLLADDPRYG